MKIIRADEAGSLIADGATLFLGGLAMTGLAEEVLKGLERSFLASGHPRQLTTWACGAIGNSGTGGMVHFAHPGMIKRTVAGHFGQTGKEMMKMVFDGEVEAYNFPQGSLSHLTRHIAARTPGLLTKVGLGTFVDPRLEGGKLNETLQRRPGAAGGVRRRRVAALSRAPRSTWPSSAARWPTKTATSRWTRKACCSSS